MSVGWTRKLKQEYQDKSVIRRKRKTSRPYRRNVHEHRRHVELILNSSRYNASKRGLEWNLKYEDLNIPTHCPYLGTEITYIQGKGRVQTNFSIDRIDSSKGYIPGNVEVMSDLANRMKQDATGEQLVAFAKHILNKHVKTKIFIPPKSTP